MRLFPWQSNSRWESTTTLKERTTASEIQILIKNLLSQSASPEIWSYMIQMQTSPTWTAFDRLPFNLSIISSFLSSILDGNKKIKAYSNKIEMLLRLPWVIIKNVWFCTLGIDFWKAWFRRASCDKKVKFHILSRFKSHWKWWPIFFIVGGYLFVSEFFLSHLKCLASNSSKKFKNYFAFMRFYSY